MDEEMHTLLAWPSSSQRGGGPKQTMMLRGKRATRRPKNELLHARLRATARRQTATPVLGSLWNWTLRRRALNCAAGMEILPRQSIQPSTRHTHVWRLPRSCVVASSERRNKHVLGSWFHEASSFNLSLLAFLQNHRLWGLPKPLSEQPSAVRYWADEIRRGN